jgi:hypothetical protein
MSEYTPFGDLYQNSPKLIIHGRLQNCKSVKELAQLAKEKGFEVQVEPSGFMHDVKLNEGFDAGAPLRNHSLRSAKRFLETHPGC